MVNDSNETSTRQKILASAASLFAEKGFTETSIRELAKAVGMEGGSIYNHFPSKNAILEQILADYRVGSINFEDEETTTNILKKNPTTEGMIQCLQTIFPPDRAEYFLKILHIMLHEQLRNPFVRSYMSENIILRAERKIRLIIEVMKKLGFIRQDTESDYWMKVISSLSYSFMARMMLGIGDNSPEFTGRGMADMYRFTFDLMLEKCGIRKP